MDQQSRVCQYSQSSRPDVTRVKCLLRDCAVASSSRTARRMHMAARGCQGQSGMHRDCADDLVQRCSRHRHPGHTCAKGARLLSPLHAG